MNRLSFVFLLLSACALQQKEPSDSSQCTVDISLDRESLQFQPARVRLGESTSKELTLVNNGDCPITIGSAMTISDEDDVFRVSRTSDTRVGSGDSFVITLEYLPVEEGADEAILEILISSPQEQVLQIPLSGQGTVPKLVVEPNTFDFGEIGMGCEITISGEIRNDGEDLLTVRFGDELRTNAMGFRIDGYTPFGENKEQEVHIAHRFWVSYAPQNLREDVDAIAIYTNDPRYVSPMILDARGVGVVPEEKTEVFTANGDENFILSRNTTAELVEIFVDGVQILDGWYMTDPNKLRFSGVSVPQPNAIVMIRYGVCY